MNNRIIFYLFLVLFSRVNCEKPSPKTLSQRCLSEFSFNLIVGLLICIILWLMVVYLFHIRKKRQMKDDVEKLTFSATVRRRSDLLDQSSETDIKTII